MRIRPRPTRPGETSLQAAAELLRTVAHPVRLRLIQMILQGAYTVGELAEGCGLSSATASGHLRLMRQQGLLAGKRDGRRVYYRAVEPGLSCILEWVVNQFRKSGGIGCGRLHRQPSEEVKS